jgi:phosphoribosyl 1,2-cyclic phosphodiesterase
MGVATMRWLGTGSAFNYALGNNSFYVERAGGALTLVDCGPTTAGNLMQSGRIADVTDIAITHLHADHVGGLEALGFYHYFVLHRRGDDRPMLRLPTATLAHDLWEHTLRGGMANICDEQGEARQGSLETFFRIEMGARVAVAGMPAFDYLPTLHVEGLESYALRFENGDYFSADTVDPPPHDPKRIFQDCEFSNSEHGIHITYGQLIRALPREVRAKTWLTHLNPKHEAMYDPADGFAGLVMPGDKFTM